MLRLCTHFPQRTIRDLAAYDRKWPPLSHVNGRPGLNTGLRK